MKRELLVESLLIKSDGKVFTDIIHDMNNVGICVVLYNKMIILVKLLVVFTTNQRTKTQITLS